VTAITSSGLSFLLFCSAAAATVAQTAAVAAMQAQITHATADAD